MLKFCAFIVLEIKCLVCFQAEIRESWLNDMSTILDESIVANNSAQAEAAIKKHEAISAEILARVCQSVIVLQCQIIYYWILFSVFLNTVYS